jgi:hypothetical protein
VYEYKYKYISFISIYIYNEMIYIYIYIIYYIYITGLSFRMGITVGIRKLHGKTMDDNGAQLWKMDRPNGLYDSMWLREQLE